jgi:hypothetical protein
MHHLTAQREIRSHLLSPHAAFWLEAGEIWIFAAYWALKSYEMSLTKLESDPGVAVGHAEATGAKSAIARESAAGG